MIGILTITDELIRRKMDQHLKLIKDALNKANQRGVFTLDESVLIHTSLNRIQGELNKYENLKILTAKSRPQEIIEDDSGDIGREDNKNSEL